MIALSDRLHARLATVTREQSRVWVCQENIASLATAEAIDFEINRVYDDIGAGATGRTQAPKAKSPAVAGPEAASGPAEQAGGLCTGGEGGIRTRGEFYPTHAFQACDLNRSSTSPASKQL